MRTYVASVVSDCWNQGEYIKIRALNDEEAMRLANRYTRYRNREDSSFGAGGGDWRTEALRRVPLDTSALQGKSRSYVFDRSDTVYDEMVIVLRRPSRRRDQKSSMSA